MKIPASKVPAQMWAEKAKAHYGSLSDVEREVLELWESSKQVYRVNDGLWNEMSIEEAEELPMSLLNRMPYDCLFIQHRELMEVPLGESGHRAVIEREGYFCFRDDDGFHIAALNGRSDFMPRQENAITPMPVSFDKCESVGDCMGVITKAVSLYTKAARDKMEKELGFSPADDYVASGARLLMETMGFSDIGKLAGTLMYICSKEADVRTVYVPQKNQSRKSRQTDCTVHDVGFRIAPQLAEVRRVYEHDAEERIGGATGRHVAPHVRRGHWHGYWTGPRENPTGLEIKWIAPTVVNSSRGELAGTVHEVGDRDGRYNLKSTRSECGRASEQLNGGSRDSGQLRDGKSDR